MRPGTDTKGHLVNIFVMAALLDTTIFASLGTEYVACVLIFTLLHVCVCGRIYLIHSILQIITYGHWLEELAVQTDP